MAIDAVIFDWGGTLTPWHDIDLGDIWRGVCASGLDPDRVEAAATALLDAEQELWRRCRDEHRSGTLDEVFALAGVEPTEALLAAKFDAWTPHTYIDPAVPGLLAELRGRGIRVGVLSNTIWSRDWHERIFARDGVLDLLDGAVYSSEIPYTKPHREAFRAALAAVGATDPATAVFVGDRPYDDIHGAKSAGMRGVLVPNSTVPAWDATPPDAVIGGLDELLPHIDRWSGRRGGR
ncbi:HAD family hydrolase [Actinomadura flavalba]|uniref:HAD family hydrolase n=1 Tax=Actinomadura flavalba TaxID=1120938 RepID=UPI000375720F|nr:HAD family hydrolase [Actinomadura flavalba]